MTTAEALAMLADANYPVPLAYWTGHGTLVLCSDERVRFRSDSRPDELEDWPVGSSTPHPGLVRVRRIALDIVTEGLRGMTALPFLKPFVAEASERLALETARARAAEDARLREHAAENAARAALAARYGSATRGWRAGTFNISLKAGFEPRKGLLGPGLSPVDGGVFGIHREDSVVDGPDGTRVHVKADEYTLTHIASGMCVARGKRDALKVLAARLLDTGTDWTVRKPGKAELARSAPVVLAFKRTGDPLTLAEEDHARIAREVSR